ncbi:putative hydrolase of the alpha/beta superfamily [Methylophaga frappieri]|uniref:Putative hydrolase of the alpha/beta superfamily n=2 Tax=Methylophaga frappieri (strain ATCC BAA-2434 / DSM 25690 / JAM7) TaxID=754477 RepID=I1YH45_METFJ|nr:putative hydrolase of the alpha/beta superfamily [Methylophaga frappieri]
MLTHAAPDFTKPVGTTIVDSGSDHYQFSQMMLDSIDGQRHYRVTIAVPKTAVPEHGFPVLYLLDGNAVIADLSDSLLAQLANNPPVIVALGYDTDLRFDLPARTRDYTPKGNNGQTTIGKWQGGGADDFFALLNDKIQPLVEKTVTLNRQQQGIWGHSFGGLFVLYAMQKTDSPFRFYASADPAFWWMNGEQIAQLEGFADNDVVTATTQLLLMHGEKLKKPPVSPSTARFQYDVTGTNQRLVSALDKMENVSAVYQGYQLTHGPLFKPSMVSALRWFSDLTASVKTD